MRPTYIPPGPMEGYQLIMAVLIAGVFILWLIFGEDIARWFRANFSIIITRTDRHTPSVSNLSSPTHVLSSGHEPEPDEDELRIARNNRMAERLHPFDRVLIRDEDCDKWEPAFFAYLSALVVGLSLPHHSSRWFTRGY